MNQSDFIREVEALGIKLTPEKLDQLERYYELLITYNEVMNLTGITQKEDVYLKHFYDSLTIVKMIDLTKVETLCDMGSGAGLPGIVLKIVFPNLKVLLIDSLNKRVEFLKIVIDKLGLKEIDAIHYRIEEYGVKNREIFDVVTARAVAGTNILLEYAASLVKINGYFIPLKGHQEDLTLYDKACQKLGFKFDNEISFLLPVEESQRTILKFKKISSTPFKYPRKNSEIKKSPL